MSRHVELTAYYRLGPGVLFAYATELAGRELSTEIDGAVIRLRLPGQGERRGPRNVYAVLGHLGENAESAKTLSTKAIEARVGFWAQGLLDDAGSQWIGLGDGFQEAVDEAERTARLAVMRLRSWARLDQPWLGLADETLEWASEPTLTDLGTGAVVPGRPTTPHSTPVVVGNYGLGLREAERAMASSQPPSSAMQFLADARYLAHWASAPAYEHAVIAAAAACEMRAKELLRAIAEERGTLTIVNLLLDNPRYFPHAALELFSGVAKAVAGRSLRDDDKNLFTKLSSLFETRNKLAHRGTSMSEAESANHVRTAIAVFEWLDRLRTA